MNAWRQTVCVAGLVACAVAVAQVNKITAYEKSQGWRLLFDGTTGLGWHGYKSRGMPANWRVADESLECGAESGPALVSDESYRDFELAFQWKIAAGGRAEVFFRMAEDASAPGETGPVFQLAGDGVECGGNGGLIRPWRETRIEPERWYRARLTVFGKQVEYWIDDSQISSYLIDGPEWRAAVAASRFAAWRDFGKLPDGAIALSGAGASFRNIRLKPL